MCDISPRYQFAGLLRVTLLRYTQNFAKSMPLIWRRNALQVLSCLYLVLQKVCTLVRLLILFKHLEQLISPLSIYKCSNALPKISQITEVQIMASPLESDDEMAHRRPLNTGSQPHLQGYGTSPNECTELPYGSLK